MGCKGRRRFPLDRERAIAGENADVSRNETAARQRKKSEEKNDGTQLQQGARGGRRVRLLRGDQSVKQGSIAAIRQNWRRRTERRGFSFVAVLHGKLNLFTRSLLAHAA